MCTNKLDLYSTIQKGGLQVKLFSDWKTQHMTQHTEHIWTQISTFPWQASRWEVKRAIVLVPQVWPEKMTDITSNSSVGFSMGACTLKSWCNIMWQRWIFFSRPKMHHAFVVQHASFWLHHNGGVPPVWEQRSSGRPLMSRSTRYGSSRWLIFH